MRENWTLCLVWMIIQTFLKTYVKITAPRSVIVVIWTFCRKTSVYATLTDLNSDNHHGESVYTTVSSSTARYQCACCSSTPEMQWLDRTDNHLAEISGQFQLSRLLRLDLHRLDSFIHNNRAQKSIEGYFPSSASQWKLFIWQWYFSDSNKPTMYLNDMIFL